MYGMLHPAFGTSCMNRASVFEWPKKFKEGREPVRDDERCGRSKEVTTPELICQIKNFMDKDRGESIETISAQVDISVGTVHTIIHGELRCGRFAWSLSQLCPEKIRKKDVVMTIGRWSSWSIQIPSYWCSGDLRWKLDLLPWSRGKETEFPGKHAGSPRPRRPDRANPPTNFW